MTDTISYQSIFAVLPTPSVVLLADTPKFTVVEANDAYLQIARELREDVLGKGFFEAFPTNPYLHEKDLPETLNRVLCDKKPFKTAARKYRLNHLGSGKKEVYLEINNIPLLDEQGAVRYIIRSVGDVTDVLQTKKNEKKITESLLMHEDLLRETQRIAHIGSWEVDLVTHNILWSGELREIYEVPADYKPTFETSLEFFKHGESRDTITRMTARAMDNGEVFDLELPVITARGNERWVRITGKAELIAGTCKRIYGATQDITEKKRIQDSLVVSRNKLNSLIQSVEGIVWEADIATYRYTFLSNQVVPILGYSPEAWLKIPDFWRLHIYPADRKKTVRYCHEQARLGKNFVVDYRMIRADGSLVWIKDMVTIISENGRPKWIRGLMIDISLSKRATDLEHIEKTVLELNSRKEVPVETVLTSYLKGIELLFPKMKCSIVRIRDGRMSSWASVSIPKEYNKAIENMPIGPHNGSCGTAAYLRKRIIASDIANDPHWTGFQQLALPHRLLACWSDPIIDSKGAVVATFGIYYQQIKSPNEEELRVIDRANALLTVLLENREQSEVLEETSFLMAQGQELAHFGNWQWNIITNQVGWSDTLYDIYGQNKKTLKATFEGYLELIHPDDRGRVYRLILSVLKTGKDAEFEERILRPSGEVRYLKSWARLRADEKGTPWKMIGACMDITESKKVQEELLSSETRLSNLVDAQTNYVIRLDSEGRYTYANKKYIADFGWLFDKKEPVGLSGLTTVTPYHHERVQEVFRQCVLSPNRVFHVEIDKIRRYGGVIPTFWHFICLTDSQGKASELQCIGIDVSQRKKAEEALKLSNERYEYVNLATHDAIYDWDVEGDHIEWGEGFQRLFGHKPHKGKFQPRHWAELLHPEEFPAVAESLKKAMDDQEQKIWSSEYRMRQANGSFAYVEEKGYILRDRRGKAVRMIGALRDITERKLAETKLRELHEELETSLKVLAASNADLEQFAYVASHDLQEPLRMVTGFLTQLEKKYEAVLDEKAKKYIFFAVDGAKRMRQIILDLLDYSRVGRSDSAMEEVNLGGLIPEILALFRKTIRERHAEILFKDLPTVRTYRSVLRQVFQNLIDNALKYQKQEVTPRIRIAFTEKDRHWQFSVSDNGIGIDPEYHDKIFVIFQRLHTRDQFSGTGMGLAITKKIVETLGGEIWLESAEGTGSTFYFTIAKPTMITA